MFKRAKLVYNRKIKYITFAKSFELIIMRIGRDFSVFVFDCLWIDCRQNKRLFNLLYSYVYKRRDDVKRIF